MSFQTRIFCHLKNMPSLYCRILRKRRCFKNAKFLKKLCCYRYRKVSKEGPRKPTEVEEAEEVGGKVQFK